VGMWREIRRDGSRTGVAKKKMKLYDRSNMGCFLKGGGGEVEMEDGWLERDINVFIYGERSGR
jgi:hypothetical protein